MNRPMENLDTIADQIRQSFSARDTAREKVLTLCREVIRYSSTTIRAVHRQEFAPARELLNSAANQLKGAEQEVATYPEFRYTGFFRDAQKEFSEASITLALVSEEPIPAPDALGVEYAAYLNGLGEAVGELRRYLLDGIRRDDLSRVESLLSSMDDIYNVLVTMDFPDAITSGLRRTTDMVRGVLERTRSDLTLVIRQNKLEQKLRVFEDRLP
jgi:translin